MQWDSAVGDSEGVSERMMQWDSVVGDSEGVSEGA
jgi:hypothetical protein